MPYVRATRACLAATALLAAATLASPSPAGTVSGACNASDPCLSATLPAPITIETGATRFRIERNGHTRRLPARALPFPRDVAWFPGTGAWYAIRHGHLVVGRWRKALWRSTGRYPARFGVGVVTVENQTVAYSYRTGGGEQLYVAPLNGPERHIARNEFPLGWTRGGFYAYRYRGHQLLLRHDTGALERTVVRNPVGYAYDSATRSLYFIRGDDLMRAHGAVTKTLVPLRHLGLPRHNPDVELMPVDGLVELLTNQRLILLELDGSLFAETRLASPDGSLAGDVTVAPDGRAVAYTSLSAPRRGSSTATDTVYVLAAGAHAARAVHSEQIDDGGCESWAGVQWRGRWLLYSAGGYLAVVDSTGRRPAIELTAIIRRLVGRGEPAVTAYWRDSPPAM